MFKKCYLCKEELPLDSFGRNRSKPDGCATECKKCKSEIDKKHRKKYKSKIKKQKQGYYLDHREETIRRTSQYAKDNRVKHNEWGTKAKNKLKLEVFTTYCDDVVKCKNCTEDDLGILTIDHIHGNGADHRRELFGHNLRGGGYKMYQWIKRNDYPTGFQVLCYNCQFCKRAIELKPDNPTHRQKTKAAYARRIKAECLDNYGGKECPCGETDIETLTLDHVNDDGAEHRRNTGTRGNNFYHMLKKNGFPNDVPLQVLCLNCQIRKRNEKYSKEKI